LRPRRLQQRARALREVAIDVDDGRPQQAKAGLGETAVIAPELADRASGRDERGAVAQPAEQLARDEVPLPERDEEAGVQNDHV
jgi:hypothetical protein